MPASSFNFKGLTPAAPQNQPEPNARPLSSLATYEADQQPGFNFNGLTPAAPPEDPIPLQVLRGTGRGAARFFTSLPSAAGGLMREAGERAEEGPTVADHFILRSAPFVGEALYQGKKLISSLARKTDLDQRLAEKGRELTENNRAWVAEHFPRAETQTEQFFEDLGSGGASLLTAIGITALSGGTGTVAGATAAPGLFGLISKGNMYNESREAGKSPETAGAISTAVGTAEALLEKVGLDWLEKRFGQGIMNHVAHGATEGLQEFMQSGQESLIANLTGVRQEKALDILKSAGYEGFIGALLGSGTSMIMHRKKDLTDLGIPESEAERMLKRLDHRIDEGVRTLADDLTPEGITLSDEERKQYERWWMETIPWRNDYTLEEERLGAMPREGIHAIRSSPVGREHVQGRIQEMQHEANRQQAMIPEARKEMEDHFQKRTGLLQDLIRAMDTVKQRRAEETAQSPIEAETPSDNGLPEDVMDFMTRHNLRYDGEDETGHRFTPLQTNEPLIIGPEDLNGEGMRVQLMRHYRDLGLTKDEHQLYRKRNRDIAPPATTEESLKRLGQKIKNRKEYKDRRGEADEFEKFMPVEIPAGAIADQGEGSRFTIKGEEFEVKKADPGKIILEDGMRYEVDEFTPIPVDHGLVKPAGPEQLEVPDDMQKMMDDSDISYLGSTDMGHTFESGRTGSSFTLERDRFNSDALKETMDQHHTSWDQVQKERHKEIGLDNISDQELQYFYDANGIQENQDQAQRSVREALDQVRRDPGKLYAAGRDAGVQSDLFTASKEDAQEAVLKGTASSGQVETAFSESNLVSALIPQLIKKPAEISHLKGKTIRSTTDFASLLIPLRNPFFETSKMLFLDKNRKIIDAYLHTVGSLSFAGMDPAEIVAHAPEGTETVYISHNHPGGNPTPSREDINVTQYLEKAIIKAGYKFGDHIITNGDKVHFINEGTDLSLNEYHRHPAEKVKINTTPKITTPEALAQISTMLRQGDAANNHIVYVNSGNHIVAVQRIRGGEKEIVREAMRNARKLGSAAVLVDIPTGQKPVGHQLKEAFSQTGLSLLDVSTHEVPSFAVSGFSVWDKPEVKDRKTQYRKQPEKKQTKANLDTRLKSPAELIVPEGKAEGKRLSINDAISRVRELFPEIHFRTKNLDRWQRSKKGCYFLNTNMVKTRDEMDISAICHEVAHWWQEHVFNGFRMNEHRLGDAEMQKELRALDYDQGPEGQREAEGFAEFVRFWLTGQSVDDAAPKFRAHFENSLLKEYDKEGRFEKLKTFLTQYRLQGSEEFVKAQIGFHRARTRRTRFMESVRKMIGTGRDDHIDGMVWTWKKIAARFWDDAAPYEYLLKQYLGGKYYNLKAKHNPLEVWRSFKMKAGAMAEEMINHGAFNIRNGQPITRGPGQILKDVVKGGHSIEDFIAYVYAKHAKTWWRPADAEALIEEHKRAAPARKKEIEHLFKTFRPKNPGITLGQCQTVIDKFQSKDFDHWGKEISTYFDALLAMVAREGGVSMQAVMMMKARHPYYVPLLREMFDEGPYGLSSKGAASQGTAVKRAKGSDRAFEYYMDAWIRQTERLVLWTQKARLMNTLQNLSHLTEMMPLIKKTSPPVQQQRVKVDDLLDMLNDMGYEFESDDMMDGDGQQILNLFFTETVYRGKKPIVSVWKGGKRQWYELDPRLFEFIQQVENKPMTGMIRLLSHFARGVRLGATGINPAFVLYRNVVRDALERTIMSQSGKATPLEMFQGMMAELARGKEGKAFFKKLGIDPRYATLFARSGSVVSTMAGYDRQDLQKMARLVESRVKGKNITFGLSHPIEGLRLVFAFLENANRIPEFKSVYEKTLKETGDKDEAFIRASRAAQDVTTDFARAGTWGRQLNQIIPFYNANVQGFNKLIRGFSEKEIVSYKPNEMGYNSPVYSRKNAGKRLAKGLGWISGLSLLTYLLRKPEEWEKLTDFDRSAYFHFWLGGHHIRIVTPFLPGAIFHGATQAMLADKEGDPAAVQEYLAYLWENHFLELFPMPERIGLLGPMLQVKANKSWSGRPIESPYARDNQQPKDIAKPWTTETAKTLTNLAPLNHSGISPVQFDYLADQYTGGAYRRMVGSSETLIKTLLGKNVRSRPIGPWSIPVLGSLFARPSVLNNRYTERFYDHYKDMRQRSRSDNPHPHMQILKNTYTQIRRIRKAERWSEARKDKAIARLIEQTVKHIESGKPDARPTRKRKPRIAIGF